MFEKKDKPDNSSLPDNKDANLSLEELEKRRAERLGISEKSTRGRKPKLPRTTSCSNQNSKSSST